MFVPVLSLTCRRCLLPMLLALISLLGNPSPANANNNLLITEVTGIEPGQVVSGKLFVQTHVTGMDDDADYNVRYQIDGPSGFINTAFKPPFVLSGGSWDTTEAEPGEYQLNAYYIRNHRVWDFRRIKFTVVRPLKITAIQGVEPGGVHDGPINLDLQVENGTPSQVTYHVKGPQQYLTVTNKEPFGLTINGEPLDTRDLPAGEYTIIASVYRDGQIDDRASVSFTVAKPEPETPDVPDNVETPTTPVTPGPAVPPADNASRGFIGVNLAEVTYYTREWVFADAMKQARAWLPTRPGDSNPWDSGETLQQDSNGWPILKPGQAAHTITLHDMQGAYPAGRYVCTYEGSGEIAFGFDASVVRQDSNRIELDVNPSNNGIYLRIDASDPNNPVRNIRIWHPGLENSDSAFHPVYINRLRPFSVLRFMDWARTNGSDAVHWNDRPQTTDYSQAAGDGVAVEYMIALCNQLGADPWFCMPHKASDDYVRNFAKLVKQQLRPDLKVYIEWSNEVWNTQFPQHRWVRDRADGQSLSRSFIETWAQEADRDFDIWRDVFEGQTRRVVRVAASHKDNPWVTGELANALDGKFDAISCSTYFALTYDQERSLFADITPSYILDLALNEITRSVRDHYQAHGKLARDWSAKLGRDIPLVSYEGGQHYTVHGGDPPWANTFLDLQRHDKIYDAYLANMRQWEQAGGSLLVAFNFIDKPDKWGAWGQLEFMDQDISDAPKYRALLEYDPIHDYPSTPVPAVPQSKSSNPVEISGTPVSADAALPLPTQSTGDESLSESNLSESNTPTPPSKKAKLPRPNLPPAYIRLNTPPTDQQEQSQQNPDDQPAPKARVWTPPPSKK